MNTARRLLPTCVENADRSRVAEAFARIRGGDAVEAYGAGSRPSGVVDPKAIAAVREPGYDPAAHGSGSPADIPDGEYEFVAIMGCRDDWPIHMGPDELRGVRSRL